MSLWKAVCTYGLMNQLFFQKTPRELTFEEFLQKCQCGCGRRCVNMGWASIKKPKSVLFAAPQASCRTGSLLVFSR